MARWFEGTALRRLTDVRPQQLRQFPEITLGGIRVFCSDRFPVTGIGGPLAGRR